MTDKKTNPEKKEETLEEKAFNFERYKFKMEMFKWVIGSVALVIITIVIDKGFKERTAGIQEMQAFDKYVEIILKADNIEGRWKLAEYFSIVTPTERLRIRWLSYKDSIRSDYFKFRDLKAEELMLQDTALITDSLVKKKLNDIHNQLVPLEKSLVNVNPVNSAELYEEQGFSYLIKKDVTNSIISFEKSEKATNGYHRVYEIANYLKANKSQLLDNNSNSWKTVYKKIATDYSWKMPANIKDELLEKSK